MPDTPDEELVRRLLADARHDEPMPADVAARLDGVLADLAAEEPVDDEHVAAEHVAAEHADDHGATVLAARRRAAAARFRRRRWATALVAAAAVVVGGVTLRAVWPEGMSDGAGSASEAGGGSSASDSGSKASSGDRLGAEAEVDDLHRATLRADVRRAVERLRTPLADVTSPPGAALAPFTCAEADWGPGTAHPVRLDGVDAMLVLRPPAQARQVVDVIECRTARRLASVTLPAR